MADSTGHMDRPGAGPMSVNEFVNGIPTNHYTHSGVGSPVDSIGVRKPDL
jgi:hypothetical protein